MIKFSDKDYLALSDLDELAKQVDLLQKRPKTPTSLHKTKFHERTLCTYVPSNVDISSLVDLPINEETASPVDVLNKIGRIKGIKSISSNVEPFIFKGEIYLPPMSSPCNFNSSATSIESLEDGSTSIEKAANNPGIITAIYPKGSRIDPTASNVDSENPPCWRVEEGEIIIPWALYNASSVDFSSDGESTIDMPHEGIIKSIKITKEPKEGETESSSIDGNRLCIVDGEIQIPLASSASATAGFVKEVQEISSTESTVDGKSTGWSIYNGIINIPRADTEKDLAGVIKSISAESVASNADSLTGDLWSIVDGAITVPLAQFSSTENKVDGTSGLISQIQVISTTNESETSVSSINSNGYYINDGIITIPCADTVNGYRGAIKDIKLVSTTGESTVDLAAWGIVGGTIQIPYANTSTESSENNVAGVISGVQWTEAEGQADIENGIIKLGKIVVPDLPLAQYGGTSPAVEGKISGIGWQSDSNVDTPTIEDGFITIPRGTLGEISLAHYDSPRGGSNVAGVISGITQSSSVEIPYIDSGIIYINNGIAYEFDQDFFTVSENTVSLNLATIDEIVQEAMGEVQVEVTANGVLSSDSIGNVNFSTTTTTSDITNPEFDTLISR